MRVGEVKAGAAVAHVNALLKNYTTENINPEIWMEIFNRKQAKIHEVMSNTDRAIYKMDAVLTAASNTNGANLAYGGYSSVNNNYSSSTKILTLRKSDINGSLPSPMNITGMVLIARNTTNNQYSIHKPVSVVVNNNTTLSLLMDHNGVLTSINTDDGSIMMKFGYSEDEKIIISGYTWYRFIDQVLSVYDSGIADECVNAKTLSNFRGIVKSNLSYNYKNSIIWVRDGEYMLFAKGSGIASYGVRTMHFSRKPFPVTSLNEEIDLPWHLMDLFYSLCMLEGLQVLTVPIPQELKSAESQVGQMQNAKEKEISDLLKNKTDN